jgi:putative membrane protein
MRRSITAPALLGLWSALLVAAAPSASRVRLSAPIPAVHSPTTHPALDDATIVAIFDATNTADIETGGLAAERAHSKDVRTYGSMLVQDHQAVRQLGRDLAKKLGVTPTPPADDAGAKAHTQAMATLRTKSGAVFDQAFLDHEIAFHKAVIDAVQTTLLPAIKDEELKALVAKVAPAFQAHMLAAEKLRKAV